MAALGLYIIENAHWQIGILPETGASVAFGRIKRDRQTFEFFRPTPESKYREPSACASFPLIPWSNRIRNGHFKFRGTDYQLQLNGKDGTAIHGVTRSCPWQVESFSATRLVTSFNSSDFENLNFPFRFSAHIEYLLSDEQLSIATWLKNDDNTPMPAGFGHHPYFVRSLVGGTDPIQLEIPCTEYFPLEDDLPLSGPVPIEPRVDFRQHRPLGNELIDDCLTGRIAERPVRFTYDESGTQISLHMDPIFQNVVLYAPQDKPFFAVEPVTNANDGFNLYEKDIPGSGVFVLEPREEKYGMFAFQIEQPPH
jgi:aldose 1-epimerase